MDLLEITLTVSIPEMTDENLRQAINETINDMFSMDGFEDSELLVIQIKDI